MLILLLLPLFFSSVSVFPQRGEESSCCRFEVSTERDNSTALKFTLTNLREQPIQLLRSSGELDFRLDIWGADGRRPELTNYAKREVVVGSSMEMTLNRGQSMTQQINLRNLYVLKKDTYTVTISRDVFIEAKRIELRQKLTVQVPSTWVEGF
jgi:hypothetical protein